MVVGSQVRAWSVSSITVGSPGSSSSSVPWAGDLSRSPDSQMPKHRASSQQQHPNAPGVAPFGVPTSDSG